MPFWLPNGTVLLRADRGRGARAARKRGYQEIKTPQVLDEELWHRSGHWDNYRENMYFAEPSQREGDQRRFALKPMNCPGACLVYGSERHSYRDLPLRLAEFGHVSRYEREGVLHGLLRVRAFTQDDAHVYCTLGPDRRRGATRSARRSTSSTRASASRTSGSSSRPGPRSRSAPTSSGSGRRGGAARGARAPGPRVRAQPGRGHLLRAEDRLPRHRRARPLLAVRHLPARLPDARALRPHLHRRRQRRAPAGDDPPRAARLDGALRRHPDRALRRAASRSGWRRCRRSSCRWPTATTTTRSEVARGAARGRACASSVDERSESVGKKIRDAELAQGALHARRRRPRGGGRRGVRALARARATLGRDARSRVRSPRRPTRRRPREPDALRSILSADEGHPNHAAPLERPCP